MIRTQIYIPDEIHQAAKALAQRKKQPLAKIFRQFITQGIIQEKKQSTQPPLSTLSKNGTNQGPKDLSANMDKYLYDK